MVLMGMVLVDAEILSNWSESRTVANEILHLSCCPIDMPCEACTLQHAIPESQTTCPRVAVWSQSYCTCT